MLHSSSHSFAQCRASLIVLLNVAPDGVYTGSQLPYSLCALTAHFHNHRKKLRYLFSVALSLRSPSPAVSRHPCSMEPGLSSRGLRRPRLSDLLSVYFNILLIFCQHKKIRHIKLCLTIYIFSFLQYK